MWPFSKPEERKDTDERLSLMEKRIRRLEEEWSDVYHKFRVLQMRTAKQVQRLERTPETGEPQPEGSEAQTVSAESPLTPRQQQAQLQIMRRRNRVVNGG